MNYTTIAQMAHGRSCSENDALYILSCGVSPKRFCGSEGLQDPEGLCEAGHYCALGSNSPVPADETNSSVGGLCAAGFACVKVRDAHNRF